MSGILERLERVPLHQLKQYPSNPRIGDVEAIAASLDELDQFAPLVIQRSTGYILAGNHTHQAAEFLGWEEIDVVYIDVDDSQAKRIVLAANRIADLGSYNDQLLLNMLADVLNEEDEDSLLGTGYTAEDVDELLDAAVAFDLPESESREGIGTAAAIFDRIMPQTSEDEGKEKPQRGFSPTRNTVKEEVTDFVLFRFGELQAKVPRAAYDEFVHGVLKDHDGDLSIAGIGAAAKLGLATEDIEPAIATGTERWL